MNYLSTIIKNSILHNLISCILLLFLGVLLQDIIRADFGIFIFAVWMINLFVSIIIHFLLFFPSIYWYNKKFQESTISNVYKSLLPILLLPIGVFLFITTLIYREITAYGPTSESIEVLNAFCSLLITAIFLYSISLYTFIQKIHTQKINQNEKDNKSLHQ